MSRSCGNWDWLGKRSRVTRASAPLTFVAAFLSLSRIDFGAESENFSPHGSLPFWHIANSCSWDCHCPLCDSERIDSYLLGPSVGMFYFRPKSDSGFLVYFVFSSLFCSSPSTSSSTDREMFFYPQKSRPKTASREKIFFCYDLLLIINIEASLATRLCDALLSLIFMSIHLETSMNRNESLLCVLLEQRCGSLLSRFAHLKELHYGSGLISKNCAVSLISSLCSN